LRAAAGHNKEMDMNGRIPARAAKLFAASLMALAATAAPAAAAAGEPEVIFNNLPTTNPGNVSSVGFEATQAAQFGTQIETKPGSFEANGNVTVGMSSWACEKGNWTNTNGECKTAPGAQFSWPVTLRINAVGPGNTVGGRIFEETRTFKMPYRPSQNNKQCTGSALGAWYYAPLRSCFHGKYFHIMFPVNGFLWPSRAIVSVAYNTSDYGATPQRPKACDSEPQGCPYDSLNVGLVELAESPTPEIGSYPLSTSVYWNTLTAGYYCDGGAGGTGTFRLDEGCWTEQPLIKVKARN
jgi:hypothetical protein